MASDSEHSFVSRVFRNYGWMPCVGSRMGLVRGGEVDCNVFVFDFHLHYRSVVYMNARYASPPSRIIIL